MVVLFSQERDPDDFTIPADLASTQPYIRLLTAADMKKSKQVEVSGSPQDITRQISSISFNVGRSTNHVDHHTEAATERIRGEPPVNNQRNSVVETLELSPLPLGLVDEDDSFARSIIPVRHRNEVLPDSISPIEKRKGKNDPKQDKETSPGSVSHHRVNIRPLSSNNLAAVVVPDLNEYSSTSELIPLSIAALKDEKSRRLLWLDNASLMTMSLTLANIWRLPTFLYFNYPGEALIAYVILMIIVGLPLYVLELSLGQFSQTGITKLWSAVPFFQGIGIAQMMAGIYQAFYFPTLMTWAFQYGILGISNWSSCETPENLTVNLCPEPRNGNQYYGAISKEENCFESHVLHHVGENMNYKMLPMLAVAMILVILGASFGTKVMKIVLSISGVFTAIILSASLALALTHPNNSIDGSNNTALHGISLLIPTEPWSFGRGEVWYGAMVQVIFSLALGFGTLPSQTSKSYFTRNIIRDGVVTWLVNLLFAIISVLTVFAWVGISGLDSTNVVKTNAFIYFVYYHISDSLWAGLVFALIFLAGLNSMLPLLYAILQNLSENFPILKKRYRVITSLLLLVVFWIVNVPGLIPVGNEVVMIWDHYAAGATVLSCLIVHLIGWLWAYGRKNVKRDLECMIVRPISGLWIFSWSFVTIILLTIAELWGFFGVPLDGTVDCLYPIWVVAAGWSFYLLALVVALVIIIKTVVNQAEYGLVKKLATSMKPDRHWGPQDPLFHSHWKRTVDQQPGLLPYSRGNTITRWLKEDVHEEISSPISSENVVSNRRHQSANISLVHLPRQRHHDENGLVIE